MLSKICHTFATELTIVDEAEIPRGKILRSFHARTRLPTTNKSIHRLNALDPSLIWGYLPLCGTHQSLFWIPSKPFILFSISSHAQANPHTGMWFQFNNLIFRAVQFSLLVRKSKVFGGSDHQSVLLKRKTIGCGQEKSRDLAKQMSPGKTTHTARTNRYGHSTALSRTLHNARLQIYLYKCHSMPSIQEPLSNFSTREIFVKTDKQTKAIETTDVIITMHWIQNLAEGNALNTEPCWGVWGMSQCTGSPCQTAKEK